MTRNEQWYSFISELRAYVEEHHLFLPKHTLLLAKIKYTRKKIKAGTLEDWKREMFEEIERSRNLTIHTGGRKRKEDDTENK